MMTGGDFALILTAFGGGTAISTILTTIFQRRKYKADAKAIEMKADAEQIKNEQSQMDYLKKTLIELSEQMKADMKEVREANEKLKESNKHLEESNRELEKRVDELNNKVIQLMRWITVDDRRYRTWLEERLQELDPNIEFPDFIEPPNIFDDDPEYA